MQPQTLDELRGDPGSARGDLEKEFGSMGVVVMPGDAEAPILKPRSRCLLSGPPGCGKTTLAHHISARLGVPMLVMQSSEIIGKYLGESARNLSKTFRAARRNRYDIALFFDEFDALAKSRGGLGSEGADNERSNITITLLQEFDRYDGLLFAATNVTKDIDPAIWRRFQLQIEIGFPGMAERFAIVRLYLAPYQVPDEVIAGLATIFEDASPALIREGCEAIKRSLVLGPRMKLATDLPSIVERFAASAAAAEGMPEPLLWQEPRQCLKMLADLPWPPDRG